MVRRSAGLVVVVVCLAHLGGTGVANACTSALEKAYWRFEEGSAGTLVPAGPATVLDSLNLESGNDLRRWDGTPADPDTAAPLYTTSVPAGVVPRTGQTNTLALQFTRNPGGGGDDLYGGNCINKAAFIALTVEASFKVTFAGGGDDKFQGIVCKEGAVANGLPRLALKVRGDNGNLQIELFDGSGTARSVQSLSPIVPGEWYHAAVVNDGSTLSLYLKTGNGSYLLQGTDIVTGGALYAGDSSWVIGRAQFFDGPADWTDGIIDEVRVLNEALDPEEFLFAPSPVIGDFDNDSDVDGDDMILLINCATGPAVLYNPQALPAGCTLAAVEGLLPADLDKDGDIDSTDFALFQVLLGS